jgi:hypothetical protein
MVWKILALSALKKIPFVITFWGFLLMPSNENKSDVIEEASLWEHKVLLRRFNVYVCPLRATHISNAKMLTVVVNTNILLQPPSTLLEKLFMSSRGLLIKYLKLNPTFISN